MFDIVLKISPVFACSCIEKGRGGEGGGVRKVEKDRERERESSIILVIAQLDKACGFNSRGRRHNVVFSCEMIAKLWDANLANSLSLSLSPHSLSSHFSHTMSNSYILGQVR